MRIIGLTGGIASGKSTVAAMFGALGARVIDADAIYHALIRPLAGGAPSPLAQQIATRFPGVVRSSDGELDRAALGARVFADAGERTALEAITHPAVAAGFQAQLMQARQERIDTVIYDVPLLFERGLERGLDGVVVVWVPRRLQEQRLRARDGLDAAAVAARLDAQLALDAKKARATWVIDNSGSLEQTRAQVAELWPRLRAHPSAPAGAD